jgi:SET domain-containing protein
MKSTKTSSPKPDAKASKKPLAKKSRAVVKKAPARSAMRNRKAAVRDSPIHGLGVVARIPLAAGERICEYRGERIGWPEALRRHPHDPEQPFHTFYFSLDDDTVIDGNVDGDFSRFMNHSCEPNCEAELVEGKNGLRVFILALRDIAPGEELVYNYGLSLDERYTPTLKKQFACHCGSVACRGTMLSPKR